MKKVVIIQARMGSVRFPGKVLAILKDKPLIQWVVEAATKISLIDQVVVATSDASIDDPLVDWCEKNRVIVFRGSELDVLSRFYEAATVVAADVVIRITADCPLLDPNIVGQALYLVANGLADYASNILPAVWPDGLDCEVFTMNALKDAYDHAKRSTDREHVTPYIRNNQHKFKVVSLPAVIPGLHKYRWTVDTPEDLAFIQKLVENTKENASTYDFLDTLNKLDIQQPVYVRNEGFKKSLQEESVECFQFQNSKALLKRALKTIPLGAQTFSKSFIQYPQNVSPLFLTHGQGSRVWDVDGNEYIDFVSALMPVVLGYNDAEVNYAIQRQLQKGISFSLSTELEILLAEKLCSIIPCAEKVRFAKNGTDVTSAAIRLARAYTGRDKLIVCGYHGWQDWYIGTTTRNKGVPKAVAELSISVSYNDLNRVEELLKTEQFAAIIMEPCNSVKPVEGYLQEIKNLCEMHGSVLVFDEIITGFRFSLGGAQEYFGVTPHLSCFGKAMGNGMPISAIVGHNDIMKEMEEVFFSGTFGGEALSLSAALATIQKIEAEHVINSLWDFGQSLAEVIEELLKKYDLSEAIRLLGYAPWKIFQFIDNPKCTAFEIKTLFIQEMIKRGILINSSLNINFSHGGLEKNKLLQAIEEVFSFISFCLEKGEIINYLKSPVIKPLFKLR